MACKLLLHRYGNIHPVIFRTVEGGHHVEEQILHLVYQRTCIVGIVNCTVANRKLGGSFDRFAFLVFGYAENRLFQPNVCVCSPRIGGHRNFTGSFPIH